MAITIDGKSYDETKLDDKCKTSIVQVNQLQSRLKNLAAEFDNVKVLIKHHSEYPVSYTHLTLPTISCV